MANDFASVLGWYFLPSLVTGWLQTALYTIFIRAGDPKPAPGTPRYVQDRRKIQIFVIVAYLLFTIVEADYQLQQTGDYYSSLGVSPDVTEKALQSRFRRLTVQCHPDKVSAADRGQVEALFVYLKHARDVIADPVKRFAYDRFGLDVLRWQSCKTVGDFVHTGVRNITMYYVGTGMALLMTGLLGYLQTGKFWRYLVLGTMFVIELHVMTRPQHPLLLTAIVNPILSFTRHPPILPFQLLALLRKIAITIFIAISQLEPLFRKPGFSPPGSGDAGLTPIIERSQALTIAAGQEVSRILGLELTQYGNGPNVSADLRQSLKEWLIQNTVRNDAELKQAIQKALEQRRLDGADRSSVQANGGG